MKRLLSRSTGGPGLLCRAMRGVLQCPAPATHQLLLPSVFRGYAKRVKIARLPRLLPIAAASSTGFYGEDGGTFSELGVSDRIEEALVRQNFTKPSRVQAGAMAWGAPWGMGQRAHA
jgi:hypothetical protein